MIDKERWDEQTDVIDLGASMLKEGRVLSGAEVAGLKRLLERVSEGFSGRGEAEVVAEAIIDRG